jgi:uncharacterized GH25 family protein
MRIPVFLAPALLAVLTPPALAHYNMLLPQSASAKKGEAVTFTYQWGHPFEHQLFDAPAPAYVVVRAPDGKESDLTKSVTKTTVAAAEGKKVVSYQFKFTPEQRGDYVFKLETPPIWMEEDGEFLQDFVKVVLHVQAQKGWDGAVNELFEFLPLTRPYGLQPGMVFQARMDVDRARGTTDGRDPVPLAGALIEIEKYNATAPKELPPDEHITRTAKTDPRGVVTTTLTEAGWWCLTATRTAGKKDREGKSYPVRQRSTLWVYVDEKPGGK